MTFTRRTIRNLRSSPTSEPRRMVDDLLHTPGSPLGSIPNREIAPRLGHDLIPLGRYAPQTTDSRDLLRHELTHVVPQQSGIRDGMRNIPHRGDGGAPVPPAAGVIQTKLAIGMPGDQDEQDADRISDKIMQIPEPQSQRGHDLGGGPAQHPREQPGSKDERLQTKRVQASDTAQHVAPPIVQKVSRTPGQPLDPPVRAFMEPRFGRDLSAIRVHTDRQASEATRSVNALAYTAGSHIVFGEGRYLPESPDGRRLLAHELAHVIQQGERGGALSDSQTAHGGSAHSIQRKPDDKKPAVKPAAPAPKKVIQKGLSRTLYVVSNDVWEKLPEAVRTSALQQLNTQFAFVGEAKDEKAFSIKVVTPSQFPEQLDFSESVVSVIRGNPKPYVSDAFARQRAQINSWLTEQQVPVPTIPEQARETTTPELIGQGGGSKSVIKHGGKSYALPIMAGAVDLDAAIESFLENVSDALTEQLEKLPKKGRDPIHWPATMKSKGGSFSYQPLEMLGEALGRAIAHEARHEYMGAGHAETGLGQESPYIIGEKTTANFSKEDRKAILAKLRKLEAEQGKATVVPTYPQSIRSQKGSFPF